MSSGSPGGQVVDRLDGYINMQNVDPHPHPTVNKTSASNNAPEHDISEIEARCLSPHS